MEGYSTPKKMRKVGELFARYKSRLRAPQATVEKACVEAILHITGMEVNKTKVVYTVGTKTIKLNVSSIVKTEIKFKQREVLEDIKKRLGDQSAPEVIL